jgi:hypothetical protein
MDVRRWFYDTVYRADDSLSGVAAISYAASGAQTIPETTVDGRGPIPIDIIVEGTTTLTATACDSVGNNSEPQKTIIKIALPT